MPECGGPFYVKKLRRTDWLPIGGGDSDEESERGSASDAESVDPYEGSCSEASDCSSLRSDGHLSQQSDGELSASETDLDEDGFPIVEDPPILGEGDFTLDGQLEPLDDYEDLFEGQATKRRKVAE